MVRFHYSSKFFIIMNKSLPYRQVCYVCCDSVVSNIYCFFHGIVLFTAMSSRKKKTPRNNDSPVSGRSCNRSDRRSVADGISILARTTEDQVLTGLSSNRDPKHRSDEHHKPGQDGD